MKPEGLRDEMQRASGINTDLEGRVGKHTGEANAGGLNAYSVGEQTANMETNATNAAGPNAYSAGEQTADMGTNAANAGGLTAYSIGEQIANRNSTAAETPPYSSLYGLSQLALSFEMASSHSARA